MPHDALLGYLKEVEDAIGNLQEAYVDVRLSGKERFIGCQKQTPNPLNGHRK